MEDELVETLDPSPIRRAEPGRSRGALGQGLDDAEAAGREVDPGDVAPNGLTR